MTRMTCEVEEPPCLPASPVLGADSSSADLSRDFVLSTIRSKLSAASALGTAGSARSMYGPLDRGDPLMQWVLDFEDLHLVRKIGEGGFGQVRQACRNLEG
jgi:hypothetical protein